MALSTSPSNPPLLCQLGWHRPRPIARWNHGYYFSNCRRCGTDLVRTAFGGWQVPKGFRVVWQAEPPADATAVKLQPVEAAAPAQEHALAPPPPVIAQPIAEAPSPEPAAEPALADAPLTEEAPSPAAAEPAAEAEHELAIGKLLRHLHDNPPEPDPPSEAAPVPEPEASEPPRSRYDPYFIPDFMDDHHGQSAAPPPPPPPPVEPEAPAGPSIGTRILGWSAAFAAASRRKVGDLRARIVEQRNQTDHAGIDAQYVGTPAVAFLTSLIIIAAIIYFAGRPAGEDRIAERRPGPAPAVAEAVTSTTPVLAPQRTDPPRGRDLDSAFITASIVNCRAGPAQQAPPVRRIVRGERVDVLALDQNWVSVAYRGGQCWVLARYISSIEPLAEGPALGASGPPALSGIDQASRAAASEYQCPPTGYSRSGSSRSQSAPWSSSPGRCTNM
jgi:hypothetical protein